MDEYYYKGYSGSLGYNPLGTYYPVGASSGTQRSTHEAVNAAVMWGAPSVEIAAKQIEAVGRGGRQAIKQLTQINKMAASAHVNPGVELGHYNPDTRQVSIDEALSTVDFAKDIGVKKVVIHPSNFPKRVVETEHYFWDKDLKEPASKYFVNIEIRNKVADAIEKENLEGMTMAQRAQRFEEIKQRVKKEMMKERFVSFKKYIEDNVEDGLKTIAKEAKKKGVEICVENLYKGMYYGDTEKVSKLVEKLRRQGFTNVFTTFDVAHAMIGAGANRAEALKQIKQQLARMKYLHHVHLADNFGRADVHLPPGEGILGKEGFDQVMKMLKSRGFLTGVPSEDVGKMISESMEVMGKIGPYRTAAGWSEWDIYHTPEGYGVGDVSLALSGSLGYPPPTKKAETWSGLNPW